MNILLIHPLLQLGALALAFYAAFLGLQRTRSLHFGATVKFKRNPHAGLGATSLLVLLTGMIGGLVIFSRFRGTPPLESYHGLGGMVLLPFLLFGIFSGMYLYASPPKTKILSALHGINNLLVLLLAVFQMYSGILLYLHLIATGK
ncbi:MAG: hypothetical protein ACYC9M_03985 [Desulfobulbaceae bacterium]